MMLKTTLLQQMYSAIKKLLKHTVKAIKDRFIWLNDTKLVNSRHRSYRISKTKSFVDF